ncbi:MAG: hypothetical protein M9924_07595 [Rhizobiaceae bacterium]|nr:hypothetical protein [Rhizobiaceae bacterium]
MVGPAYIGDRAVDAEDETFAYRVKADGERPLAFVGPARNIGPVTGDAERDTIAYRPLTGVMRDGLWIFVLVPECEISEAAKASNCRLPSPALTVSKR